MDRQAELLQHPLTHELNRLREENLALRKSLERVEGLAYRDALTGLRNRRYFDERLEEEIARLRRSGGSALSVLVLDLDGFKQINDTRGHAAGDEALVWIARFLDAHVRITDACCRVGGDEFAMLLPDTSADGCATVASYLRRGFEERFARGEAPVSFSLGHASSRRSEAPRDLLARADAAMYEEKAARRSLSQRPRLHASFAA